MHLDDAEDLAYRRLIDWYYDTELPIPLETQWVARRLRVGTQVLERVLKDFFTCEADGWHHWRCDQEISDYQKQREKNRVNGAKGGRKPKRVQSAGNPVGYDSVASGNPLETQVEGNQEPITNNQEPIPSNEGIAPKRITTLAKPDGVPDDTWRDFQAIRKAKRAPLTSTALDGIKREAEKAGLTLADAITYCCEAGWQGFKADWYMGRERTQAVAPAAMGGRSLNKQEALEARNRAVGEAWLKEMMEKEAMNASQ